MDKVIKALKTLELVKHNIDKLQAEKYRIECFLADVVGHNMDYEGAKTYDLLEDVKVTVTTGLNYRVNARALGDADKTPFKIVKTVLKYEPDKKEILALKKYGSEEDKEILDKVIISSFKKPSVVVKGVEL